MALGMIEDDLDHLAAECSRGMVLFLNPAASAVHVELRGQMREAAGHSAILMMDRTHLDADGQFPRWQKRQR